MPKDINNIKFFAPEIIFGSRKLVDIQTGDFFPFGDAEEIDNTKQLLTGVYPNIEIKGGE